MSVYSIRENGYRVTRFLLLRRQVFGRRQTMDALFHFLKLGQGFVYLLADRFAAGGLVLDVGEHGLFQAVPNLFHLRGVVARRQHPLDLIFVVVQKRVQMLAKIVRSGLAVFVQVALDAIRQGFAVFRQLLQRIVGRFLDELRNVLFDLAREFGAIIIDLLHNQAVGDFRRRMRLQLTAEVVVRYSTYPPTISTIRTLVICDMRREARAFCSSEAM